MPPRDPSSAGRSRIHHRQSRGQRRCMKGSPGPRIARPLATDRTRSCVRACEAATHHCWKHRIISTTPPKAPCVPFANMSRRRSNIGCGGASGSTQQGSTYLEVLLHTSRSLPPTLKGCWRSQGSYSCRPMALIIQQQQQQHSFERNHQNRKNWQSSYLGALRSQLKPSFDHFLPNWWLK